MGKYKYKLKELSGTGGGAGAASFTPGAGAQYATPYAFGKKVKNYYTKKINILDQEIYNLKYKLNQIDK